MQRKQEYTPDFRAEAVKTVLGQALWSAIRYQRPAPGLIHHCDRGSQYCAWSCQRILDQHGLLSSMSRKGNCYDNAPMESFWGSLKNELIHHRRYETRARLNPVSGSTLKFFTTVNGATRALAIWHPPCLHSAFANYSKLLEAGVSPIARTAQSPATGTDSQQGRQATVPARDPP